MTNPYKNKHKTKISKLVTDLGDTLTGSNEISNEFNQYFASVGKQLSSKIKNKLSYKTYLKGQFENGFFLSPTTENEIKKIISNLNSKKAAGMDNIRPKLLKACSNELANGLAHIANLNFENRDYSDQLKMAKVIPLSKKGEPHLAPNYRPISLLSFVCLKFFIRHNETALLKQNYKYKINTFSIFLVKTLLCT